MGDESVNAKIGVERKKLLKEKAESLGQSITAVVTTAIDDFLSEEKKACRRGIIFHGQKF